MGSFVKCWRPLRQSSRDFDAIELLVVLALYRNDAVNDLQHPRIHQCMKVLAKQYPLCVVGPPPSLCAKMSSL